MSLIKIFPVVIWYGIKLSLEKSIKHTDKSIASLLEKNFKNESIILQSIDGIGPEQLKVRELLLRLQDETIQEIIIATNTKIEGEATAMYLSNLLKPLGIKITRIAQGLPVGGDIQYADEITLAKAFNGRWEI